MGVSIPGVCIQSDSSVAEYDLIKSVTRTYNLYGYSTRFAAEAALLASPDCPLTDPNYTTLIRKPINVNSTEIEDEWIASVTWEEFIPDSLTKEVLSGSISLSTQNVKSTYNHVGSYGPGGGAALDAGGLINVTQEGVEGVDLEFPVVAFQLSKLYPKGTFTLGWLASASQYCGLPNTLAWRGFASGTVKLINVDGSNDGKDFDNIVFSFAASPTFTNIVIPSPLGNITVPEKLGWQYLHLQYVDRYDPATGFTSKVPVTAHVDELSPGIDINALVP